MTANTIRTALGVLQDEPDNDQAWTDLQQGRARTMYVDDGAPVAPVHLAEFVVTSVELVYLELQVIGPRELMQPYYAFRESGGSVLYVPAVAF